MTTPGRILTMKIMQQKDDKNRTRWGTGDVFSGTSAELVGGSGIGFYVQKKLTNKITCDNRVDGAVQGLSNIPCTA